MGLFTKAVDKRCPICGGKQFYQVPVGRAEVWHQQVEQIPQWKQARGLPAGAGVAFSEPRLERDQPTFDRSMTNSPHVRCLKCASCCVRPQFLSELKSRVLLITTGMPAAGKTTWLKCLFNPSSKKHLIAEPTTLISREPYDFVEPYTIANPDPRTAVPILLHGMRLTFQRKKVDVAGIDVKGKLLRAHGHARQVHARAGHHPQPAHDVVLRPADDVRGAVRRIADAAEHRPAHHAPHQPPRLARHVAGGDLDDLDRARLLDAEGMFAFLQGNEDAVALARRVVDGNDEVFDSRFVAAATEIERLVQNTRTWTGRMELLESLTWLLYRIMIAYTLLPLRFGVGKVEFFYGFQGGLGETLVRQCMRLAAVLFAAWDSAGRGDFAGMIREAMRPGAEPQFPVLPCGIEFLPDPSQDGEARDADDGLPVWGDLLLLELLRRHG